MGGPGSTRWRSHCKAPLVEDTPQLNVTVFGPALRNDQATGVFRCTNPRGELDAEFVFALGPVSESGTRRLEIEPTSGGRKQSVHLERARLGWHVRWLFKCPSDCGRRARKLFALPRWMTFTCRRCAGLTYKSAQQHDSRVDLARRDPEGFLQSRSRVPETLRSKLVTASLVLEAQNRCWSGRGWSRTSTTSVTRAIAAMREECINRLEEAKRAANGG